jgi:hypothetical protein
MSNKDINTVLKELREVASITIREAGEGRSLNPEQLVALTHLIDSWIWGIEGYMKIVNRKEE